MPIWWSVRLIVSDLLGGPIPTARAHATANLTAWKAIRRPAAAPPPPTATSALPYYLNTSCKQQYKQRPAYRDWCPALPGQRLSVPKDLGRAGQQPAGGRPALGLSPRLTPFPQSRAAPRDWHGRGGQVRWVTATSRQLAAPRGRHRLPGRAVSPPGCDSER